ncbi:HIT family protein [Brevibacterium sp. GP-SGM9]|uniref:HIT family protein n=1 Tax=Brevibacterium sp. GP-SGM9 TaxID=3376990 RepID=UPI0039A6CE9B
MTEGVDSGTGPPAPGEDHLGEGIAEPEAAAGFPGEPDGFQRLWTPHRMVYIGGQDKPKDSSADECPFCTAPSKSDAEGLIVARGETVYAVLNLYPYNPGHLLICPYRHVADYTELSEAETVELAHFTQKAMRVIRAVSNPHGFNLGMNQGPVAGAGIAAHLHQHIVPRWGGDANFLPIVAETKALPQVHSEVQAALSKEWNR